MHLAVVRESAGIWGHCRCFVERHVVPGDCPPIARPESRLQLEYGRRDGGGLGVGGRLGSDQRQGDRRGTKRCVEGGRPGSGDRRWHLGSPSDQTKRGEDLWGTCGLFLPCDLPIDRHRCRRDTVRPGGRYCARKGGSRHGRRHRSPTRRSGGGHAHYRQLEPAYVAAAARCCVGFTAERSAVQPDDSAIHGCSPSCVRDHLWAALEGVDRFVFCGVCSILCATPGSPGSDVGSPVRRRDPRYA